MKINLLFLMSLLVALPLRAEFHHPDILSFEDGVVPVQASCQSKLSTSTAHYKHGGQSLCWQWKKAGAALSVKAPIAYEHIKTVNSDNSLYSFVFWLYLEQPMQDSMRFEFLKDGKLCCWFNYGLQFSGWSGAWVAFRRDMLGRPEEGMNELRIVAPSSVKKGKVYLDHIILSSLQDSRYHTADLQAPYINPRTESHWLVLLRSWQQAFDIDQPAFVTKAETDDLERVRRRMDKLTLTKKYESVAALRERFAVYQLPATAGLPVFFERYGETYEHYDRSTSYTEKIGDMGLAKANKLLLDMAQAWRNMPEGKERDEVRDMFLMLTRHLLDQGFRAGSALGTLHHLGYSMRQYYPAMYLMREPLREAHLIDAVQQSMEWFSGVGEVKKAPQVRGMDIDAFNTSLEGRLMSILLLSNEREAVRYMRAFSRWVDNGYRYSDGLSGSFKPDGTIFHHCNHYPAYAVGGLSGAVDAAWLLAGTGWAISEESHRILRQSLLAMRIYCNDQTWPLSLSGRHPDGKGHLLPRHYDRLAKCGTPDGKEKIDKEVRDALKTYPQGSWAFPYSCLLVQRRDRWMVAIKGHSRYIWNTETYRGCNHYGRYLNYGNVQILGTGDPISNFSSGFRQEGWDWSHWPGTTATVRPIDSLRANINNLDNNSGYEEMLQSDESFCNGLSLLQNGIWGMKLHSHDKYDGSLHARKSVFCFDNRIVCLGSNIESAFLAETHTTLFQVNTEKAVSDIVLDTDTDLKDGYGNRYLLRQPHDLYRYQGVQHSRHEETDAPTEGHFATVAINHGTMPHGAGYEYMIVVQDDATQSGNQLLSTYQVVQCDSLAHIVRDEQSGMTGYVLFEAGARFANSLPCLVATQPEAGGMILVVSDPDLHLYEGPSDETYDANGKRKERIIYSYPWNSSPSRESQVSLLIPGKWSVATEPGISALVEGDHTRLVITCQHGMSRTLHLVAGR